MQTYSTQSLLIGCHVRDNYCLLGAGVAGPATGSIADFKSIFVWGLGTGGCALVHPDRIDRTLSLPTPPSPLYFIASAAFRAWLWRWAVGVEVWRPGLCSGSLPYDGVDRVRSVDCRLKKYFFQSPEP